MTFVAFTAHAEGTAEDTATARQLAEEAQEALDAGKYETAVDRFSRAEQLHHAPTLLLGLARAYKGFGKYVRARETYQKIIVEKLAANAPDPFLQAQADARREIVGLDEHIASVTIVVSGADEPEVTLDGEPVPAAALGVGRAVDAGEHRVTATAPGFLTAEQTFSVEPQGSAEVSLELEPDPDAVQPTGDGGAGATSQTQSILAYVALGVGGAGLLVGAITGGMAMGKHGDLEEGCPAGQCPPEQQDTLDSYRTLGTVSTVGFIAGGVLAATGVVLLLTAPSAESSGEGDATVTARFGPGAVQATVTF